MAKAIEGIPWDTIEKDWCSGVAPREIAQKYGISESHVRGRACRKKWLNVRPTATKTVLDKAAKKAVKQAVAKATKRLEVDASRSVDACIEESIRLGRKFMERAENSIGIVEDGNLSGVATLGKTGVEIWRKGLGLDVSSSGSPSCGISFSFVMRQDGLVAVNRELPSTNKPVTLDAEVIDDQGVATV
jgi:hypothetical protein